MNSLYESNCPKVVLNRFRVLRNDPMSHACFEPAK